MAEVPQLCLGENMIRLFIALFLVSGSTIAKAQELLPTATGSCNSTLSQFGYFYASTTQTAIVNKSGLVFEQHQFTFQGFLTGMEAAPRTGYTSRHVKYANDRFEIAVPFVPGAGLLLRSFQFPDGIDGRGGWIKLCSY